MTTRYHNRIVADPKIMLGKPTIKGTRITVELLLRQLAQGLGVKEILGNYPRLTKEDMYAAIEYATQLVEEEKTYFLDTRRHHGKTQALAR
jgi:uncharacterized protein (DUF433 family)